MKSTYPVVLLSLVASCVQAKLGGNIDGEAHPNEIDVADSLVEDDGGGFEQDEYPGNVSRQLLVPPEEETPLKFKGQITTCNNKSYWGKLRFAKEQHYWKVWLQAGADVTIQVDRVTCGMDPAATLYYGTNPSTWQYIKYTDDEDNVPKKCETSSSPGGDPRLYLKTIPYTGWYTLKVVQNKSSSATPKYKVMMWSRDRDSDGVGEACDRCPLTNSLKTNVSVLYCTTTIKDKMVTNYGCSLNDVMLKHLRSSMNKANAGASTTKEIRKLFRDYMFQDLVALLKNTDDARQVQKCVNIVKQNAIRNACGNRFLASDQQFLYMLDHKSGRKQFLGRGQKPVACYSEAEYDFKSTVLWMKECEHDRDLYKLHPSTGTLLKTLKNAPGSMRGMEMVGSTLYGAHVPEAVNKNYPKKGYPWTQLVKVNPDNGFLKQVGPTGVGAISGLAYDIKKGIMWGVTDTGPNKTARLVTINLKTGAATLGPPVIDAMNRKMVQIKALEIGPDGLLYGGVSKFAPLKPRNLVRIDTKTGKAMKVQDTGLHLVGLTCYTVG